jgi:hypothetical protein
MKSLLFIIILTSFFAGCSSTHTDRHKGHDFSKGKELAELTDKKMEEASGLAASINNSGLLWTHNDSFNGAQIFLVNRDLDIKLTCDLAGVENRDWEDITVGPGPDPNKNYVYVGEIGDNLAKYSYKVVYRFEEPVLSDTTSHIVIRNIDKIFFKLPDGKKDTESLFINPATKDLYIVSKREEPVHLYELEYPQSVTDTIIARDIMTLPFTQIVAGDFSPDGSELLLKNYKHIYYWAVDPSKPLTESLQNPATELPYEEEPQGEAITFSRDGSGYYTISERNPGKKSFLLFYERK